VQELKVTPADKQDVEINYWIDDRNGKKVGENQLRVQPGG
jgi:beta-mannosidase